MSRVMTVIAVVLATAAGAWAQEAKVRASIETMGDVYVGQRVTLVVELLAPGYFSGSPSFDLPDPPSLLIVPPRSSPVVSSETIGDTTYTVQRHELAVFAHRGGEQTVPAIAVRFHFKRQPLDKDAAAAAVKTEPLKFVAKVPPGAEKLGGIISAKHLTATESWKPEPGKAKAGDAFTRTITFAAPDVPAMAFPPFPKQTIDGIGVYPKPPVVLDQSDRGNLQGQRRDTIVYVCQRPGRFVIPAVRFSWFDLESREVRTIDFPSRTIDVAPNPAMPVATTDGRPRAAPVEHHRWKVVLLVLAAAGVIFRYRAVWLERLRPTHLQPLNPG